MTGSSESSLEDHLLGMLREVAEPLVAGIGVDVEHHARWRSGDQRLATLFTEAELTRCREMADAPAQMAGTWCAKEAAVKALAAHVRLSLRDVEVVRDALGRPAIRVLPPELREHGDRVRISISRTTDLSMAVAVYLSASPRDAAES